MTDGTPPDVEAQELQWCPQLRDQAWMAWIASFGKMINLEGVGELVTPGKTRVCLTKNIPNHREFMILNLIMTFLSSMLKVDRCSQTVEHDKVPSIINHQTLLHIGMLRHSLAVKKYRFAGISKKAKRHGKPTLRMVVAHLQGPHNSIYDYTRGPPCSCIACPMF